MTDFIEYKRTNAICIIKTFKQIKRTYFRNWVESLNFGNNPIVICLETLQCFEGAFYYKSNSNFSSMDPAIRLNLINRFTRRI